MLSQKIQRQLNDSIMAPPYAGPNMEPVSAAARTIPIARPRRLGVRTTLARAIPMGIVAAPPIAWIERPPIAHPRLGDIATNRDPAANTDKEIWYTRAKPYTSANLPIMGMAAV